MRPLFSIVLLALILLIQGCADLGYYWHSTRGHMAIMQQRIQIETLLADDQLTPALRQQLLKAQQIRRFSVEQLALPDNRSYHSYVELNRAQVLHNLFAAPEFSTQLHQWCYPLVGCASYRGYFDFNRLQTYATQLREDGYDTYIGPVPAYSTLGWFDDPVLSSFINWPEHRLAGLIFHELTHQRVYIDGDSRFNESLATAVQQAGTERWLKAQQKNNSIERLRHFREYQQQVNQLMESTRLKLDEIYGSQLSIAEKRQQKKERLINAKTQHAALAKDFEIETGFTQWFESGLNNAKLGSVSTYQARSAEFLNMLEAMDHNFEVFFDYVERLAKLQKPRREICLNVWKTVLSDTEHCFK